MDSRLEDAARTLGAPEWRVFLGISLPLASRGIFCRRNAGLCPRHGEFGATLMVAGNIPGKTQTLALAIYAAFQAGDDRMALVLVLVTSILCTALLTGAEILLRLRR